MISLSKQFRNIVSIIVILFISELTNSQIAFANGWNVTTSVPNVTTAASGSNRLLIYVITFEDDDNTNDVTSVSYGGQSLTQAVQATTLTGGGSQSRVEIWYLNQAGITASSHTTFTPVFSISNPTTSHGYYTMAVTLSGVNQSSPVCTSGVGQRLTTTTVNLSSGISVLPSELVIYATHGGESRTHTPATGYTESADLNGASGGQSSTVNSKSITASGTENPVSTASGSQNRFVIAAVRIIPNGATCSSALPIELTHFVASFADEGVKLEWRTAGERNNDFFTVERSLNGIDWVEITQIKGAGNSAAPKNYSAYDNSPIADVMYYRLKQTDYDGTISYSWISNVDPDNFEQNTFKIYPNPATSELNLIGNPFELKVTNILGQEVTRDVIISRNQKNRLLLNISGLQSGTYFIHSNSSYIRFIKM